MSASNISYGNDEIGGLKYIEAHGSVFIPYLIFNSIGVVIGCTGNLLILVSILITKELRINPTDILIFNLAVADITISAFVDSSTVFGALFGKKLFDQAHGFCEFIAATCLIACLTSMVNIGFLAFNRKKTYIYCIITWFVGFLFDMPNYVGWGRHVYNVNTLSCLWDRTANHGYTLFLPISMVFIPSCFVFCFYVRIFLYVKEKKQKVHTNKTGAKNNTAAHVNVAKGLFGSFALFVICWAPYGLLIMLDWYNTYPAIWEMYTLLIAHLNSACNPILYGIYNPQFKLGYANVLRCLTRKKLKRNLSMKLTNTQHTNEKFMFTQNTIEHQVI